LGFFDLFQGVPCGFNGLIVILRGEGENLLGKLGDFTALEGKTGHLFTDFRPRLWSDEVGSKRNVTTFPHFDGLNGRMDHGQAQHFDNFRITEGELQLVAADDFLFLTPHRFSWFFLGFWRY